MYLSDIKTIKSNKDKRLAMIQIIRYLAYIH